MRTYVYSDEEPRFYEDMSMKARWFRELRGDLSEQAFNDKLTKALKHVERAREARFELHDPGGGKLEQEAEIVGKDKEEVKLQEVNNPRPGDSDNFVTDCFVVEYSGKYSESYLRLRPRRSADKKFKLETTKVFLYDEKMRQWNLIEDSGFNEADNYIWANAFKNGVYAAIALPTDNKTVRNLALMRFAFLNMKYGQDVGMVVRAADYFDESIFEKMMLQGIEPDKTREEAADIIDRASRIHKESQALKKQWPRQFPNNGLPEWQLLEFMEDRSPHLFELYDIADIVVFFPFLIRLANRVGRWHPLGPWNINGRIKSLVIHPTSSNVLYAGSANGGVWKTSNGGNSWQHLWKFEDTMAVGSLAISKSDPTTLYAATGEQVATYGPSYGGSGIYKTTNSGGHWENVSPVSEVGARCSRIEIHPTNPDIVFVASLTGVHRTIDGGGDWNRVLNMGEATDLVIDPTNPDIIFAGIRNKGIYKTINGGDNWDRISGDILLNPLFFLIGELFLPFPIDNDAGWIKLAMGRNGEKGTDFIVAKLGQRGERMVATPNGGDSWYPMPSTEGVDYNEWCTLIAIHPNDHSWIYAGGVGMQYTDNGFTFSATSGTHSDHHVLVFDPNDDNVCYVATDGGVYKSTNKGVNWTLQSRYLTATQLMSLGVADQGDFLAGSATQDQGIIQTEGGYDWDDFHGGNEWGMYVVDPNNSNNVFISPGGGELRRSTNMGRDYTTLTNTLTDYWPEEDKQTRAARWRHVAVRPGNSQIIIGVAFVADQVKDSNGVVTATYPTKERIYYTSNQGNDWSIALDFPAGAAGMRVAYAPSNPNRAYAATNNGHVYRSNNSGQSGWTQPYDSADRPPAGIITSVTVDHTDADTVYITYGDIYPNVYRSFDGGANWNPISGVPASLTLPDIAVTSLVVEPENNDILYVGTDIGVFRSNDAGYSWYFYNDSVGEFDLPRVLVTGLMMHKPSRRLFASTMGRGLYYTYTTGLYSLRVLEISHHHRGHIYTGIQHLKVSDGSQTYIMSRNEVIQRIEAGTNFFTIGADSSRAEVLSMRPDSQHPLDYVKTVPDDTLADNLLSLPEFYHY